MSRTLYDVLVIGSAWLTAGLLVALWVGRNAGKKVRSRKRRARRLRNHRRLKQLNVRRAAAGFSTFRTLTEARRNK